MRKIFVMRSETSVVFDFSESRQFGDERRHSIESIKTKLIFYASFFSFIFSRSNVSGKCRKIHYIHIKTTAKTTHSWISFELIDWNKCTNWPNGFQFFTNSVFSVLVGFFLEFLEKAKQRVKMNFTSAPIFCHRRHCRRQRYRLSIHFFFIFVFRSFVCLVFLVRSVNDSILSSH